MLLVGQIEQRCNYLMNKTINFNVLKQPSENLCFRKNEFLIPFLYLIRFFVQCICFEFYSNLVPFG